ENIEVLENVVEDEPHFFMEKLWWQRWFHGGRGSGWLAKCSIVSNKGHGGGGLVVLGGKSSSESKNGRGDVGGVEKISSTGSRLIANEKDCLDGCDGASGGEVNGRGVVLGVFK
ncbi:hypothetical protein Tco_0157327, partial [Tanacetum coccineum]